MIRYECTQCGKLLSLEDSRAGMSAACPHCQEAFRVPKIRPAEMAMDEDDEDALAFSRAGLLKALAWFLGMQAIAFLLLLGGAAGVVVGVVMTPLSVKMVLQVAFVGLASVAGFCFCLALLPNWRLFFFSTILRSSRYVVMSDRLVRYSRADKVVEEVPFANIAAVRLLTRRHYEDPDIKAKVIGIDLHDLDDRATMLDRQFCLWSQKMHRHDLVMVEDFFEDPLKTVHRRIKKRWQQWHDTHAAPVTDAEPTERRRRAKVWYQNPVTYVLGCVGLISMVSVIGLTAGVLVWLAAARRHGQDGANVAVMPPPARDRAEPPPAQDRAEPPPARDRAEPPPVAKQAEPVVPAKAATLLASWPLDEGQGKMANDASGNGAHGQIHRCEWVKGANGSALRLRDKGDFVELGSQPQLNFAAAAPFTLAGWVATKSNGVICSFRSQRSIFPVIEISVRKGQLFGWLRDDTSGFGGAKVTGGPVDDGAWHHVALLREGDGTIELFLDAASQGRAKGKSSGGPITTDLRALGCDRDLLSKAKAPGYLAADLAEFRAYDRPLAQEELTALAGRKR